MAPELFEGNYDHNVDLWSIGCILFYMIFHEHPFKKTDSFSDYK